MEGAMQSRFLRSVAVGAVLIISLAGCGGGGGTGDPSSAVKSALDAAQSGGITKLADYACAAKKGDVENMFGGSGMSGLTELGLSSDEVFAAMKIEFKDIQTTEKSKTGDAAVVHVTGNMVITVDPAKMRELMKKAMSAQGQTVDDATLDAVIASMAGSLSQTQPLDEDIPVVQEGGKWLICG
jgi:hypothetical protein